MPKPTRTSAEASFAKAQKRAREAAQAMTEVQAEAKRVADNTARLRALRLARDAEEARVKAAAAAEKAAMPRAKKPAAKKAAAVAAERLNASSDG